MYKRLKYKLAHTLIHSLGWHTNRKIIVIESDDWGSIRMPSKDVYDLFLKDGFRVDADPYCKYDALATHDDLALLFDVLTAFRDKHGRCPVITANCIVANPDFARIKASDFTEYHYEPFTETLQHYPNCNKSFRLWQEGIKSGVFYPQLHGREHLNVNRWMKALYENNDAARRQFDNFCWGLTPETSNLINRHFLSAFGGVQNTKAIELILTEGVNLFYTIFGYRPDSFIAPCYVWNDDVEKYLHNNGIKYIQGNYFQSVPDFNDAGYPGDADAGKTKSRMNYLGKRNTYRQHYLVRNCFFEPAQNENMDWIDRCLKDIKTAFQYKKPAILSAHRLNFIGSIFVENRDKNLTLLGQLLKKILTVWPDVEFFTSNHLGDLMNGIGEKIDERH